MDILTFLAVMFVIGVLGLSLYFLRSNKSDPLNNDTALNLAKQIQGELNLAIRELEKIKSQTNSNVKNVEILDSIRLVRGEQDAIRRELSQIIQKIDTDIRFEKDFVRQRLQGLQDQINDLHRRINLAYLPKPKKKVIRA